MLPWNHCIQRKVTRLNTVCYSAVLAGLVFSLSPWSPSLCFNEPNWPYTSLLRFVQLLLFKQLDKYEIVLELRLIKNLPAVMSCQHFMVCSYCNIIWQNQLKSMLMTAAYFSWLALFKISFRLQEVLNFTSTQPPTPQVFIIRLLNFSELVQVKTCCIFLFTQWIRKGFIHNFMQKCLKQMTQSCLEVFRIVTPNQVQHDVGEAWKASA